MRSQANLVFSRTPKSGPWKSWKCQNQDTFWASPNAKIRISWSICVINNFFISYKTGHLSPSRSRRRSTCSKSGRPDFSILLYISTLISWFGKPYTVSVRNPDKSSFQISGYQTVQNWFSDTILDVFDCCK